MLIVYFVCKIKKKAPLKGLIRSEERRLSGAKLKNIINFIVL